MCSLANLKELVALPRFLLGDGADFEERGVRGDLLAFFVAFLASFSAFLALRSSAFFFATSNPSLHGSLLSIPRPVREMEVPGCRI